MIATIILAMCLRGYVDYANHFPGLLAARIERWQQDTREWVIVGANTGISLWNPELDFSPWAPRAVRVPAGLWGNSIAWTEGRDIEVKGEYIQECTVRTIIPIVNQHEGVY